MRSIIASTHKCIAVFCVVAVMDRCEQPHKKTFSYSPGVEPLARYGATGCEVDNQFYIYTSWAAFLRATQAKTTSPYPPSPVLTSSADRICRGSGICYGPKRQKFQELSIPLVYTTRVNCITLVYIYDCSTRYNTLYSVDLSTVEVQTVEVENPPVDI